MYNQRKEIRKHFTQMTEKEMMIVKDKIDKSVNGDVKSVNIVHHALENFIKRTPQRKEYKWMMARALTNFTPIEFKRIYSGVNLVEERSLLRGTDIVNGESFVMVYSITNRKIITLWVNALEDMHSTLDMNLYDSNMEIY